MLEDKDKTWVKEWVREYTEPRFVKKTDCDTKTNEIDGKLSNDYADKKVIKSQLRIILSVLGTIGVCVLGLVIKQFWGG